MDPITQALKAAEIAAQAVVETMKMYQTPQGQLLLAKQMEDTAKLNTALAGVGTFFRDLFSGKLFEGFKFPAFPKLGA